MKKIISIVFAMVVALTSVIPAFADVGGPAFKEFTVYVSQPRGTFGYEMDWQDDIGKMNMKKNSRYLPYGTELTITGDYAVDDKRYGYTNYNGEYFYVDMSDVTLNTPVVGIEKAVKLEKKHRVVVIDKNGAALYDGPGFSYEKISEKIPYGTEFEYEYADFEHDTAWAYVSVNGVSGWIYVYQFGISDENDIANVLDEDSEYTGKVLVVAQKTELKETPAYDSKILVESIPVGTELTFKYYYNGIKCIYAYVEYNGLKGWVMSDAYFEATTAIGLNDGVYIFEKDGVPVYDKVPFDKNVKEIGTVAYGTSLESDYTYFIESGENEDYEIYRAYRIDYNGKKGWISSKDGEISRADGTSEYKVTKINGVQMYAEPLETSEKLKVIPENTVVKGSYWKWNDHYWRFVEYNGVCGWVIESNGGIEYIDNSEDYTANALGVLNKKPESTSAKTPESGETVTHTVAQTTLPAPAELTDMSETKSDEVTEPAAVSASPGTIIVACVAGAAVIAVTAVVTVILINKKKNRK